jgi:hypothetical protein
MELFSTKKVVLAATQMNCKLMFERLLQPGCTESPVCQCRDAVEIADIETLPEKKGLP